jgi:hypothetical protein
MLTEFIKALVSFFTGIPADWDDLQDEWELQRHRDIHDYED